MTNQKSKRGGRLLVVLLIAAVPLVLILVPLVLVCWLGITLCLRLVIALFWVPRGIRYLVVYSDSAQWKDYFEVDVLPALGNKARSINLSTEGGNKTRWDLDWWVYRHTSGYRNRFPTVYHFSRTGGWNTVRFYEAFIAAKRGKTEALESAKARVANWTAIVV